MTRLVGMTLSEFNMIIGQMKGVYQFKDDEAKIVNINDPRMGDGVNRLEIATKDEATGIDIVLSKDIERDKESMW